MSMLQIYKASAGSGKTHALTREYLKLALRSVGHFRHILAVTFTNKAAAEMKERIISELDKLSKHPEKSPHLKDLIREFPNRSANDLSQQAHQALKDILHDYSSFSVGTIDSFVQKVVRAFTFEMGLQGGFKTELDLDLVLDELTLMLYSKIEEGSPLLRWLVKFAKHLMEQKKSWDYQQRIRDFARVIEKEEFVDFSKQIQESDDWKSILDGIRENLKKTVSNFETQIAEIQEEAIEIIQSNNYHVFFAKRNKASYVVDYFTKKLSKQEYKPNNTLQSLIDGSENIANKSDKQPEVMRKEEMFGLLRPYLERMQMLLKEEWPKVVAAQSFISNTFTLGLMQDLAELLPEYRFQKNSLLISEASRFLNQIVAENDAPLIYEKVGNHYSNILIDEFQDTSRFQWENFYPLIHNALSQGQMNLIVGDVKQSIYRWRGGDWDLLLNQVAKDIGAERVLEVEMETNWRSKENIVNFLNEIFSLAPKLLAADLRNFIAESPMADKLESMPGIIEQAYSDAYQKVPAISGKKGGYVQLQFLPKPEEEVDFKSSALGELAHQIDQVLKDKNYEPRDLCVLVRKRSEGVQVVEELLKFQSEVLGSEQYRIISAESLLIKNALSVRLLLASFRYLSHPDPLNLADLRHKMASLSALDDYPGENSKNFLLPLPEDLEKRLKELPALGLYEMAEQIVMIFGLDKLNQEAIYIRHFLDCVLRFTDSNPPLVLEFLNWWENKKDGEAVQLSDKANALKVMTIHKSKGLAFKVLFIPFCTWKVDDSMPDSSFWLSSELEPYNALRTFPMPYNSKLKESIFGESYLTEKIYNAIDSLNLLYVALTRPVEELRIFAQNFEEKNAQAGEIELPNVSKLLRTCISNSPSDRVVGGRAYKALGPGFDPELMRFESKDGYRLADEDKFRAEERSDNFSVDLLPSQAWRERLSIKREASDFFKELDPNRMDRIYHGTLMHQLMAQIETEADLESSLKNAFLHGQISMPERALLKQQIQGYLQHPQAKHWFSGHWEVFMEVELLSVDGLRRVPDRLMVDADQVIVVDFKFAQALPEHHEQVREYIRLVGQMKLAKSKKISGFLYYPESKKVLEVER